MLRKSTQNNNRWSWKSLNKYYFYRTQLFLTETEPVQSAKLEKKDQDRVHPRIVVAFDDKTNVWRFIKILAIVKIMKYVKWKYIK